jgi:erythrocyte band 7 integral membrane protein
MPGAGAVYPQQPPPEATGNRRVQRSFAMQIPPSPTSPNDACYEGMLTGLGRVFGMLGSIPFVCFCFPNPFKVVEQGNVGLISKFGKFERTVDPGLYKINPYCEQLRIVDVKVSDRT